MANHKRLTALAAAVLLLTGLAAVTQAWVGQRDTLTFSGAVALPGAVLPAGAYTFQLMTSSGAGDVVRVASSDGRHSYFMGFTRSVTRPQNLPANRIVVIGEAKSGTPPPVTVWYPLGGGNGHEFIYP
jgi:hypothetical protein